jgi:hypothetical protein
MTATIVKGSLASVAKQANQSVAQSFLDCQMLVLMDVSSSMCTHDAPGGKSRYAAGCNELARLQAENPGKVGVIAWSSSLMFCPSGVPDDLGGTTDLTRVLKFVQPADGLGIQIVIISDGEPDDTVEPLQLARQFQSKLHTIFIGPEGSPGEKFMRLLATTSGGQSVRQSTSELNSLHQPLQRLLLAA